jgi:hypothetical protein
VPSSVTSAGGSQTQATGGTGLPFSGTISGTSRAAFPAPGTLEITLIGRGTATHLGQYESTAVDTGTFPNPVATGTLVLTAANGDQLFATTESKGEPVGDQTRVTTLATITGGTGRFDGATGVFTVVFIETHDVTTAQGTFSGSFECHLNLNP